MSRKIDAWGDTSRHYADDVFQEYRIHSGASWARTLEIVTPDCKATVDRTVTLWNQKIRNQLSNEIGFQLNRRQVFVRVVDGLPAPLSEVLERVGDLGMLVLNQSLLRGVVSGTRFMESVRDEVMAANRGNVGPAQLSDIRNVRKTAEAWLKLVKSHDLDENLRRIREDVLGAYFFHYKEVCVYWMAIGAFAALYDVSIEALTFVVLAHELAHAYTHLGYDIDGYDWPTDHFGSTDVAIVEGLAQFYTEVVCKNLEQQMPQAIHAFAKLLSRQHEIYSTHRHWVQEDDQHSGEIVRVSLLECRRSGKTMHRDDFAETVRKRRLEITGA